MAEVTELTVDDGYKNIRIRIDGNIVATQEIIENVTITVGCTDGSAPAFGASFSPHCDVTINSNEIIGDSALDAIVMGAIFIVECELTTGVYEAMGRFEIGQPVQYIDDYMISFSGEGMLGSVLGRKKMNWDLMSGLGDNAKKGILTLNQAVGLVHSQFPNVTIVLPSSSFMPPNYENMKIVVPLSLNKWKKNVAFKKRFVKLTARDFIAGIAVMLGGNVVEYGDSIRIVSIREAWNNESGISDSFFSDDSYVADYTTERIPYAPKSLRLKTYVTLPVTTSKKGSSKKSTHGYCYEDECECGNVYGYSGSTSGVNQYDVYVDCQWIGRSFEAFYFNGGIVYSVDSGSYEDENPSIFGSVFQYTPMTIDFSGWNDIFEPAHFIKVRTVKKNTATQQETTVDVLAYIADMTITWNGTISVQISSSYNGEAGEVTVTIGNNQASSAWNNGTNIPEFANEEIEPPEPTPNQWVKIADIPTMDGSNPNEKWSDGGCAIVYNGEVHLLGRRKAYVPYSSPDNYTKVHYTYDVIWNKESILPYQFSEGMAVVHQGELHIIGTSVGVNMDGSRDEYFSHYKLSNGIWERASTTPVEFYSGSAVSYNGEIHVVCNIGRGTGTRHYKWDGSDWALVSQISQYNYDDSLVAYNGEMYRSANTSFYKWDGSTWDSISLPYGTSISSMIVYHGYIYMCLLLINSQAYALYKFDGTTFTGVTTIPLFDKLSYNGRYNRIFVYNDTLCLIDVNSGKCIYGYYDPIS